jgi:TPP-dependent 2-oxoacid decarboxylase
MRLSVGMIVHNETTKEIGRIVRVAADIQRPGYIVVTADKVSGREIEALWQPQEVEEDGKVVGKQLRDPPKALLQPPVGR